MFSGFVKRVAGYAEKGDAFPVSQEPSPPPYCSLCYTVPGHFLVSVPGPLRLLWIEGKDGDVLGNLFRPDH